ncbi:MAG: tRNA pseudouridine(38-40) synthase TruA [Dictyoglomaceae bacterium]|nr:tRNA pseudouridine(38-40) synthase TruA [Dictyoglomaceae bacterium]
MYNWKLTISYIGKNFYGFQKQPNKRTVQGVLEKILKDLFQEDIKVLGAGRTDAGVHALNQIVSFKSSKDWDLNKLKYALCSLFPEDMFLKNLERVDEKFHARYSAKSKSYIYIIYNSAFPSLFLKDFVWWIKYPLNREILSISAKLLIGKHNFINFCVHEEDKNTIIEVEDSYWRFYDQFLVFYISASYFLRKMIRFLVGGMVELGCGRKSINEWSSYLERKFERRFSFCAPPQGLYLFDVKY